MGSAHIERVKLAESSPMAASELRALADEAVAWTDRVASIYAGGPIPQEIREEAARVRREAKELSRVCLRHAARRLDTALVAEGAEAHYELAVRALPPVV